MQEYDFRLDVSVENQLLAEVEKFNARQRRKVYESLMEIKKSTEMETIAEYTGWFDLAIVPILKEFAQMSSALLKIQKDNKGIIEATLTSSFGMDIIDNSRCLYMLLVLATMVSVHAEDNDIILQLTFDSRQFVN